MYSKAQRQTNNKTVSNKNSSDSNSDKLIQKSPLYSIIQRSKFIPISATSGHLLQSQNIVGKCAVKEHIPRMVNTPAFEKQSVQHKKESNKENQTGLPNNLKVGIESLAGISMNDVTVHLNSSKPAELQALAYTQGTNIYVGAGQEKHIPHEAWHVIQQKQGRVKPTNLQIKGASINDDLGLETEADRVADIMGKKATKDFTAFNFKGYSGQLTNTELSKRTIQRYAEVSGAIYDRVSDDGELAVIDHGKFGWANQSKIDNSNSILSSIKSKVRINATGTEQDVDNPNLPSASPRKLKQFNIIDAVTGVEAQLSDNCGLANQEILGYETHGSKKFVAATTRDTTMEFTGSSQYRRDDNRPGGSISTTEQLSGEIYIMIFQREFSKNLNREEVLTEWAALDNSEKERLSRKYGINEFAVPREGQGITIGSERDMPGAIRGGFNFHFGFNLMSAGHDYITLEDYARSGVSYYLDMYGPESKGQSWAQDPGNVNALGNMTTTMVVQHPESLEGEVNTAGTHLVDDPQNYQVIKTKLAIGTKVKIIRQGINWMKVEVLSGTATGQRGWILNSLFTNT